MQFDNDVQKATFEKVRGFMLDTFGEYAAVDEDAPVISVMLGSAMCMIAVQSLTEHEAVIATRAVVAAGASVTPDLALFLLRANSTMLFGAFGLAPNGDIILEHNLLGSTISQEELRGSILTVARLADEFDDQIVAGWGGRRALDRLDGLARLMETEPPGARSH